MSYNQEDSCQGSKDEGLREVRDYTVRIRTLKHSKHVSCWLLDSFNVLMRDCEAVCQMLVANWCYLFSFFVFIYLMLMSSLGCLLALLWEGLWLELFRWDKSLVYLSFVICSDIVLIFYVFVCCTGRCGSSHDCSASSRIFFIYS